MHPRWGKVGKQVIINDDMWKEEDIAYFDDKVSKRAQDFMERQVKAGQAVLRVDQLHPHAPVDLHQEGEHRPVRQVAVGLPRLDDRS